MKKARAIIWAAVSTTPQADEQDTFSIFKQIEDAKALCEENGWRIADTLIVPGHSRNYRDLATLAEAARNQNIDAFDKLSEHLQARDFDIFICRDANRIARKASLLHWIAETIIEDCEATIFSMHDALMVTEENIDIWLTMKAFTVRSEIRSRVKMTRDGLKKRAERGLPTTRIPFSHILLRDERLKPIKMIVDESKRSLFNDLFYLIVEEQQPFNRIEKILFERFGHTGKDGHPYGNNIMYMFLYHPYTWGSTSYGFTAKNDKTIREYGVWVFDETEDPPEGKVIYRNTLEPVYQGEQAKRLKVELKRRKQFYGVRRPNITHAFSGLFMCSQCGYTMSGASNIGRGGRRVVYALRCNSQSTNHQWRPECNQPNISVKKLREYVDDLLHNLLETSDYSLVLPKVDLQQESSIDGELKDLNEIVDNLINAQMTAHTATREAYQRKIDAVGENIEILKTLKRESHTNTIRYLKDLSAVKSAIQRIGEVIDHFWDLEETEINQYLRHLIGKRRFVVLDDKVIGIHTAPARKRRKPI